MNKKQAKKCHFCQGTKADHWLEEKHYLGSLKTAADYQKNYQGSVFYCSGRCFNRQLDKEEEEAWAKGDCAQCGQPLVVLNEQCFDKRHQEEAHYFPLDADCLKSKPGGGK